jgi:hypothetical protein
VEALLAESLAGDRKIKAFYPHAPAFLGYLIANEGYHHRDIGSALFTLGRRLLKRSLMGYGKGGCDKVLKGLMEV